MAFEFDAGSARPVDDAGGAAGFDPTTATPLKKTGPGIGAKAADLGLSLAKGVISVPEAAVGLADIPTGGAAGKAVEGLGVRFKDAKQILTDLQSDDLKAKQQEFQQADGIVDKAATAITNPSLIANAVAESLPLMGAGGVAARGVAPLLARAGMAAPAIPAAAGAIGEGIAGAGSAAEQIRQETASGELTAGQSGLAALSGAATAGFGALGGAAARRLGIADPEAMLAGGTRAVATGAPKGVVRRMAEGAAAEGLLEEVPQSLSEQAIQNVALDRPVTEGLADAAVMGGLAGGVMGAGAGTLSRPAVAPPPPAPKPAPGPLTQAAMLALPAPGQIPPGETIMVDSQGTAARRSDFDLQRGRSDSVGDFEAGVHNRPNRETGDIGQGRGSESANFPLQNQQTGELTEAASPPAGPLATAARMAPQPSQSQPSIDGPRALPGPETITDNGQPFRNGIAAQRAARSAGLGFGVVPVEGGYVVRRTNDQAQDVTPRAPSAPPSTTPLLESSVDMGAHAAATSPLNDTRDPTDPQKYAENYRMGRAKVGTFHVSIENPQGSVRRGKDEDGKAWETTMTAHYGRLPGTKAADWTPEKPQQIDAFVKPGTRADHAGPVFVIDQVNPKTGRMDEHKVIFGAADEAEAEAIYRSNYTPGWNGLGSITRLDPRAFKEWAYDGTQKTEPVGRLDRWQGRPVPQPAPDRAPAVQRPSPGPVAGPGVAPAAPSSQRPAPVAAPAPTAAPKAPAAPAPGLRVGMTPNDTVPVTVRDGTVYLGDDPALDYETGDPVKVPAGANALQIRKALTDSKSLGGRQKFFGGAVEEAQAPAPTAAAEAPTSEPKRGSAGMKLAAGEVVTTSSGRKTAPFPKVDISNNGKTQNTLKRVNDWLFSEALAEARSRGDDFNARQFGAVNRLNPSPADKDSAEEYLFGQQPAVVPSILKPLTPSPTAAPAKSAKDYSGRVFVDANGKRRRVLSYQGGDTVTVATVGAKGVETMTVPQLEAAIAAGANRGSAPQPNPTPAPSTAPAAEKQTAAQRAAAQREVQREIHAQLLADASMDGNSVSELEAIIRERAAATPLPADKVTALAKAVHKELARTKAERAKAEHRHPAVYDKAVATAVASAYPDANVPVEQHGAFLDGFRHGMAGKTKSTLTGENLPDRQKGYEAALRWRKTEEGAAWFEGRPVNKLQNTGMDLRRHWEAMRAQMKAGESDVKKAWVQIERATTRADLFAPLVPEGSTPGWKLYVNRVRDNTRTFKDWLFEQQHRWYGASEWGRRHRKEGDPGNLEFVLDGSRYPGDFDTATRQKWETSEAFRIQWLQDQAQAYLNRVDEFIAFLKGEKTVQSAAAMFQAKYVEPGRARDFADKLSDDGRKEISTAGMWDGKHHNFTSLALVSEWAEKLAQDEDAAQLPTKAQPLTPPRLDRVTRAGMPDHRGGENVTPEAFKESFGLADVGFGTWVGAKEDQDHLNYSFDAFNDLAKHFGARPKDLGFGGRLHFTIGALGHGKFAAHFQRAQPAPDGSRVQVINVTNTRGDGTLYHEWVHALDYNLGGEWGSEYKTGPVRRAFLNMLMYRVPKPADVDAEAAKFLTGGWYWSGDKRLDKVGAAIRAMETFKGSRTGKTAYKQNADNLGKDYWGNPEELIARAAEAWAVDTLGGTNTYLVNPAWAGDGAITKEKGYRGTPYPSGDERKVFAEVFGALTRAIKWKGGQPTVTLADFRKELPDWMAEGEARRKELLNRDKMVELQERLLRQQAEQKAAAQMQKEAKEREEQQRMDALAAQQLRELEAAQQPAIVDEAPPSETSGPLDASDLEDIFDQAAAELREENQERPEVEPPPDADTEPVEPPAPRAGRPTPADVQHLIEKIEGGQMVLLSGAKWAEDAGIPTIHVFTKMPGEVRHAGFGVMDYTGPEFSGNFLAGGAMSRAPDGTAYTDFTVTAGRWEYPKARVLESLRKMNPGTMTQLERDIAASGRRPAPAPEDPRAADLIAQAAKLGVKGANEALTGLAKLFGAGPGKLMSFPAGLNEETYQQAKPHFKSALTAFQEAGKTLKDLFKLLIVNFGDGVKPYAIRFAQEEGLTAKLGTATAGEPSPSFKLARTIATRLDNGQAFDWRELFAWADSLFEGTQAQGKYTPKDAYDALEMGVNLHLMGQPFAYGPAADTATAGATVKALERLLQLIPTQSKRTQEQNDFQQFSTVPTLAYMANWVANVNAADTMMEPSAGLGGLAVFAKNAGARLVLNELAARRAELLREVFPGAAVHQENAEQINNILPEDIQPSVVVMNPPFSNSATRGVKKDTMVGAQHVEQALLRLAPGGRLVAIVGEGMARDKATFREWWKKIDAAYDVRAAVPIDGSGYAKYGTTFDNVLLVIDKVSPSGRPVLTTKVTQYTELPTLLQEIRNDRPSPELAADDNGIRERDASERAHQDAVSAGESDAGAGDVAGGPGVVGEGESAGSGGRGRNRRPGGGGGGGKRRPGLRSDGDAGVDAGNDAGTGGADADGATAVSVGEAAEQTNTSELTASIFEAYRPQRLEVDGAQPHPGALVQSAAMATVLPPKPTYTPNLPAKTITSGLVSIAQLEAVVYAGQAHQEMLDPITVRDANDVGFASGGTERQVSYRRGYFIGDGTGVGKGREIGAIILDNLRQGRKKHVWISEKQGLMVDAKRDFKGVGGNADLIFNQNKTDAEGKIDAADGILFTTYSTLRSAAKSIDTGGFKKGAKVEIQTKIVTYTPGDTGTSFAKLVKLDHKKHTVTVEWPSGKVVEHPMAQVIAIDGDGSSWRVKNGKKGQSRIDQLVAWLGPDFDGVIAFDEAHNAGNAVPIKVSGRGTSEPSQQALAVVELQKRLPNARVVYVSATGATQVSNLSYATRLGLWGPGTPFPTVDAFIAEMTAGGLATMELVARDMKQMGVYLARSLSYAGVTYSRVEHELTPVQRAIYDRLAEAWQVVLQNFEKALEVTGGDKSSKAKGAARSAFWGQQQRFFNQVITSMQMPTVIEQMQRDLDAGDALVLQLVNTNEAQQERALGKTKDGDEGAELEELDLTPRDGLMQMVEKAFPVVQYEEVEEDGKKSMRAVLDAGGNPVLNREAVAMREKLLRDLKDIKVPEGPLEQVINHFGPDVVAEVTGRSRRVVEKYDPRTKEKRPQIENRGPAAARADAGAFQEDKKRILIFSDAGGTGFSFHADRTAKNQRKRKHYLIQPGWRADKAVQGFGRTHRTNAASDPHYYLASTDIPAQKRFLSAIARRLDTLGALTKGQRDTANQGMFSEKDNLESIYATQAVRQFLEDLQRGLIRDGDLNFQEFMRQTGMEDKVDPDTGRIPENKIPDTRLFLNRMLSLKLDMQAKVFDLFARLMEQKINQAIERGEFDAGLQTLKALSASVKRDEVVYTDPRSGAQTRYVELELTQPTTIHPFPEDSPARPYTYQVNERSGKVWVQVGSYESTDRKTGAVLTRASLMSTSGYTSRQLEEMATGFRKITKDEARALWEAENEAKPKTYTESAHMIVGAMLPIWDRLKSDSFFTKVQVMRTQTDDGRRYLGRVIEPGDLSEVLKRLNVESAAAKMKPAQALAAVLKGAKGELANGWTLERVRVSNDVRVELKAGRYWSNAQIAEMKSLGMLHEQIQWSDRVFVPTGASGAEALGRLFKTKPLVDLSEPKSSGEAQFSRSTSTSSQTLTASEIEDSVSRLTRDWLRRPDIHVLDSMDDAPEPVRQVWQRQNSQGGTGDIEGFHYRGGVYLVADALTSEADVRRVLFHESLGHFGLRNVFGDDLKPILQQIAAMRGVLVARKAKQYGLDMKNENERLMAAEEVLAEMAQTRPEVGWVKRAIAAIRRWLRAHGVDLALSDNDIIVGYILPARGWVERGRSAGPSFAPADTPVAQFSQTQRQTDTPAFRKWFKDSKVVDAEGKALVVYHGTTADFTEFRKSKNSAFGTGIYFTDSAEGAESYATLTGEPGANVMPVYLQITKPLRLKEWEIKGDMASDRWKRRIRDGGYDGLIVERDEGDFTYVAFRPEQIKSAIGNRGTFDPESPDIMFSRSTIAGATNRQYTPEQQRAMRNVGFEVDQPSLKERAQALWKDAGKKLAQGIADQFRPVKDLDERAYSLLRLSKGASGAFETMLHGGRLKLSADVYDFDENARGGVLDTLLIPLQGEHHDFFRWVAANRAERLMAEGRENLFTTQDIADLKTLADGDLGFDFTLRNGPRAGQTTRSRSEAYRDSLATFNAFNKNVLDLAEQSGLIDGESRHLWEHEFYVPFYRVSEDDGGLRGANIKTGVVRQEAFKKLKGGGQSLNMDLLDNTLLNWAHLLDAAAKNRGAKATLEAAQRMGVAIEAPESTARQIGTATGNKQGVVWFMDQGQKRFFVVDDPYVLTALTSLEYAGMRNPVMDAMSAFKHALTVGVTASPFFKIRNLIRDSVQVIGTSQIGANPLANVAEGWKRTDPKSDDYFRLLAGGGTIHFGSMYEGSEAKRVQALVESGVDASTILDSPNKVKAFIRRYIEPGITAYNELGNRGEAVNRAALYNQLRSQGVGHAEASLQARDLMDFSMQGSFTTIRFLTQVVPFMNARIQGMYKLGRGAKEDPARFAAVIGATALLSIALLAAYSDDDDWKKREEFDRNGYWWFKFGGTAFRIPKPFEIGAMATLAERSWELAFDEEMTGRRFRKQVQTLLADNLSMNPIPQLIKPVVDVYANKDSFTDRPIETMNMERLRSEYRFTDRSSMLARGASTAMNSVTGLLGAEGLSPVQIDHMLRGYFGWLGAFIVGAADTVARPATNQPSHPAPDYWKSVTGGMAADLRDAPSRYVSQMYEQAKEIERAYGTWRMLLREGKGEEAQAFREANADLLNRYKEVERIKKAESALNARARMIERSDMDPDRKRELLRQINEQKDRVARVAA